MKKTLLCAAFVAATLSAPAQTIKLPLMGWSSWNAYMVNISDSIIKHEADMMVKKGLKDAGYAQINIDDGFFGPRNAQGQMTTHPQRFPNGMRGVVDYIHGLGMKAGIYSDAGDNTCGSYYNKDATGKGAGLYQHEEQDAQLYFNDWDFDFIKIDYCGGERSKLDEETRYRFIRQTIDRVSRKPISINICRWAYPGTWVTECGDSWRTTGDIRPNWESVKGIIEKNLYLSAYARKGHYNDMDMLAIGYEGNQSGLGGASAFDITTDYLNRDEEDAHFGIWCIMDSPLLIGCKIGTIPEHSLQLLKNQELIALNQDPLGLQAHVVQHVGDTYVFTKDLLEYQGSLRAVALYNPTDQPVTMQVKPEELGYTGALKVRNLLLHEDLGTKNVISLQVPAHGVQMLRVEGKRTEPTLYEAEWAYMPKYTDIAKGPCYRPLEGTSGRAVADNLGGAGNDIVWENVYSVKGGTYTFTLRTAPTAQSGPTASIELTVNGKPVTLRADQTAQIQLNKGDNTIRLSSSGQMPAIDCFSLLFSDSWHQVSGGELQESQTTSHLFSQGHHLQGPAEP